MGYLSEGKWQEGEFKADSKNGHFQRSETQFRHFIGQDTGFPVERDRYHLYVSLACP